MFVAAPVVRRRYLIVVPRPTLAAQRRYLVVEPRVLPAAALDVRCRYLIMVLGPMPVAPRRYLIVLPRDIKTLNDSCLHSRAIPTFDLRELLREFDCALSYVL